MPKISLEWRGALRCRDLQDDSVCTAREAFGGKGLAEVAIEGIGSRTIWEVIPEGSRIPDVHNYRRIRFQDGAEATSPYRSRSRSPSASRYSTGESYYSRSPARSRDTSPGGEPRIYQYYPSPLSPQSSPNNSYSLVAPVSGHSDTHLRAPPPSYKAPSSDQGSPVMPQLSTEAYTDARTLSIPSPPSPASREMGIQANPTHEPARRSPAAAKPPVSYATKSPSSKSPPAWGQSASPSGGMTEIARKRAAMQDDKKKGATLDDPLHTNSGSALKDWMIAVLLLLITAIWWEVGVEYNIL